MKQRHFQNFNRCNIADLPAICLSILLACTVTTCLAACGNRDAEKNVGETSDSGVKTEESRENVSTENMNAENMNAETGGGAADPADDELVDKIFTSTRKITVEVYDRGNDGGSDPADNMYTEYIKKGMLKDHNVEVEFVTVPRWTETEQINNLLAAGDAPDICVTYDYATIQTYAGMGGVLDLSGYVEEYKALLPNLWNLLGDTNIYWDRDPSSGTLWALEARLMNNTRINTFVRKDWLEKLKLKEPATRQEFEDMLVAFRDNAGLLLGDEADKMIPYSISFDVGWRAATLIESFMDPDITDKEYYVNGFDDRKFTQNGTKEAVRLLNKWYNAGLIWKDFPLYVSGDTTEDNMMKAGYVGAFTHNCDYPYRNGEDSIQSNLKRLKGEDAVYIAVDCFEDRKGTHTKFVPGPVDRKVFFPATNEEPLACMLYLDWISDPEHIQYLQIGEEGVTHNVLEDGAVEIIAASGAAVQNSGFNIDYTITCNGLKLADADRTARSNAHSYAGIDPELIERANRIATTDIRVGRNVNVGVITAEEGMGPALSEKRNIVFDTAVTASVENFDKVWDDGMADYMSSGGQAVMEERRLKWEAAFGDSEKLPE